MLAAACAVGLLVTAAPAQAAPPSNDLFANATDLRLGAAITQSTSEATTGTEPGTAAAPAGCARMGRTVWFRVRGNGHSVTVSTGGSTIDTVAAIYDTANTPTESNRAACNDNAIGNQSRVTVPATVRGNTYLVQVGAKVQPACNLVPVESCATSGTITVAAQGDPRPANDDRADPQAIATGVPVSVDNTGATTEPGEPASCNGAPYAATIWFSWIAPDPGTPSFDASAAFTDTVMAIYRKSDGAALGCNDDAAAPAGASRVTLGAQVERGEELLVQVGARGSDGPGLGEGAITVQAGLTPPSTPPPPDLDADDDGFVPPEDCDDANAAISPLALELRGNAVDENCDRVALPFLRIRSGVVNRWLVFRTHTRVDRLTVRNAPVGAVARVACRGKGCPRKRKRLRSRGGKELRFAPFFDGRRLRPRAVVTVRITFAGRIGKVVRYRVRKRKAPRSTVRCLMPGAKRPTACPRGL
jgi:hypothetical protein